VVIAVVVVAGLVAVTVAWFVVQYNRLATLANAVDASWGDIDTQLQQRHDLVPNLVAITKAYAAHERAVLDAVVDARNVARGAVRPRAAAVADDALETTLLRVFALSEAYPELKANQSFVDLQRRLVGAEDAIAGTRQRYNAAVQDLNTTRELFPINLVARMTPRFAAREYFTVTNGA
jgi:LemA protein